MARSKSADTSGRQDATLDDPRSSESTGSYTVVARRYRPQRFEDVIGQDHVVQALRNAIRLGRVTHAYLFSGTRGVGKTSLARIFAKCLNCVEGPTETPCNQCDICQAISAGQDVDMIEIDGASNNGVEQVRELRQNAGLRPSRSRFKIYYIDEVHMLSTGAFNALLKTLEEPPEHVKFLFATTEPNKIPVTVLSRCQRFDFAGIAPEQIISSLARICESEGIEADRDALQAVARRAGGSMRDAQSLLEQLLSFGGTRLTSEIVHNALGLAPDDRVLDLIDSLANHEPAAALEILENSLASGVQPVELLNGLIEFMRDVVVVGAGAEIDTLAAAPSQRPRLREVAARWPLDTVLAALQILSEARSRMRGSPHGRILLEMALCRVARLEDFTDLSTLLARLGVVEAGRTEQAPKKKALSGPDRSMAPPKRPVATPRKVDPPSPRSTPPPSAKALRVDQPPPPTSTEPERDEPPLVQSPPPTARRVPLELHEARQLWEALPEKMGAGLGVKLSQVLPNAIDPPGCLVIPFTPRESWIAAECNQPEARARIEQTLASLAACEVTFRFRPSAESDKPEPAANPSDRLAALDDDLIARKLIELFEARRIRVELEDEQPPSDP